MREQLRNESGHSVLPIVTTALVVCIIAVAAVFVSSKRLTAKRDSILTADFGNRTYSRCGDAPVKLSDGVWAAKPVNSSDLPDHVRLLGVRYGDVTGDGQADAVVSIGCESGVSGFSEWFFVYQFKDRTLQEIGALAGIDATPVSGLGLKGNTVKTSLPVYADTDPRCCPSSNDEITYSWTGSKFVEADRVNKRNPTTTP